MVSVEVKHHVYLLYLRPLRFSHSSRALNSLAMKLKRYFTETVGLLGTGAQDGQLDFHTAPELWHLAILIASVIRGGDWRAI